MDGVGGCGGSCRGKGGSHSQEGSRGNRQMGTQAAQSPRSAVAERRGGSRPQACTSCGGLCCAQGREGERLRWRHTCSQACTCMYTYTHIYEAGPQNLPRRARVRVPDMVPRVV